MKRGATQHLAMALMVGVMGIFVWSEGAEAFWTWFKLQQCRADLMECEAAPVCGDGVVEGDEQCDVGLNEEPWNLNGETCISLGYANGGTLSCQAGCTFDTRACNKTVFVTSASFTGDLVTAANGAPYNCDVSDGLLAGDCICQHHADNTSPPITEPFKAWLSDGVDSPNTRFIKSLGGYYLPDKTTLIAFNYNDLTDSNIANPINQNEEQGDASGLGVWTATSTDGESVTSSCKSWTDKTDSSGAQVGTTSAVDSAWTDESLSDDCGEVSGLRFHLYCLGQ